MSSINSTRVNQTSKLSDGVSNDEPPDGRAQTRLVSWDELPHWQRDNEYILSGYRSASYSLWTSLWSVLAIHNETVNIHSHLFGAILFLLLPAYTYNQVYLHEPNTRAADIVVFAAYYFGVAICFFLSSSFHVIANHSPRVAAFGNQLDYLGVVILMWGATIPTVYYGFCQDPKLQDLYWTVVSTLAVACAATTLHPRFRSPTFRKYRAVMYAGLGLSALVFVAHGLSLYGWTVQNQRMSLDWMILMASLNLIGAAFYATRIPERWFPRVFDYYGSSHQIFHFMVIFAGLAHVAGLFRALHHVRNYESLA